LIYYLYGAAQGVALEAGVADTPFNPCSLDLPSIGALVGFYHSCLGFPVKQTWLDAIKAGNCNTFDGLPYFNAARYCLDTDEMIMGYIAHQSQKVRQTKPKPNLLVPLAVLSPPIAMPSNQVFIITKPLSKLFTNGTGRFPVRACSDNQYVMMAFYANGNFILQQAFKSNGDRHCIAAYNTITTCLAAHGLSVDLQILDNEASSAYKEAITFKWNATFQLVPPDMHHRNRVERAICMFKDHFLEILAGVMQPFHLTFGTSFSRKLNLPSISYDRPLSTLGSVGGIFFRGSLTSTRRPWSSWLSHPHPCPASILMVLGFSGQK
jgi:hypothetical protein